MKKILSSLILSVSILGQLIAPTYTMASTNTNTNTSQPYTYQMICRVSNTSYSFIRNTYKVTIIDEDGNAFIVLSDTNLIGQWLNVYASDNITPNNKQDDMITDFELLPDTQVNIYSIVNVNGQQTLIDNKNILM